MNPGTSILGLAAAIVIPTGCGKKNVPSELPNILWIVSEDNSAYFTGCYGNSFATTPNIDKLAEQGFLYTHAYATCAVSAPSRNSILTGVYAASNGNEPMRSAYPTSDIVRGYPEYLREAGYYCTNNSKTDYNTSDNRFEESWDESSNNAHYKNRPEGKPFFAVFNSMISHESCILQSIPEEELRHDPDKVPLPPYSPNTPEMRHDWAQYYDKMEDMDVWVGDLLKELDESGEADNTIVFYYGDNGGVLTRSKRFMYETGTQIPLVIRIPEKFKYLFPVRKTGSKIDRLVNFVDFVPTLLSIAGVPVPDYLQGDAFLGTQKTEDPEYTFLTRLRMDERFDNVRAVKDQKYRYVRNYMPFRMTLQHLQYMFGLPSAQSWEDAYKEGKTNELQSMYFLPKPVEELYDTDNDPWEINNLAEDPAYADVLSRMRQALDDWRLEVRDAGVIPETEYKKLAGDQSMYDYVRSSACPYEEILEASDLAVMGGPSDLNTYVANLKNDNSAIRYWGATGLLVLKDAAKPAVPALEEAVGDNSAVVATLAAEALYGLGEKDKAVSAYVKLLGSDLEVNEKAFVLGSIDAINDDSPIVVAAVQKLLKDSRSNPGNPFGGGRPAGAAPAGGDGGRPTGGPQSGNGSGFGGGGFPAGNNAGMFSSDDMKVAEYLLTKWGITE